MSDAEVITLAKGDTFEATIAINSGCQLEPEQYVLGEGDSVYFGVMEANQPFGCALIRKKYTSEDLDEDGNIPLRLESQDTIYLLPGTYYYQAKLEHKEDGQPDEVTTIIPKRKLFLVA